MRVLLFFFTLTLGSFAREEAVLLLHGLCRSAKSMTKMEASLREAGYVVLNIDYPSTKANIAELSPNAIGKALRTPEIARCQKVHFVTHSMGGILVRDYFSKHREPKLGRVIMLGPPNQGSEVVDHLTGWWVFDKLNGPAGHELGTGPDSTPNQLGPVSFELGVIAGTRSINWINSLMIKGPDDGKVSVARTLVAGTKEQLVLPVTHPLMMKNREAIAYTINFLRTGEFESPL